MGKAEDQEQLAAVVRRFGAVAPQGWVRLVGNWEAYHDDHGTLTLNYVTLAVVDGGDRWLAGQLGFDEPLYDGVAALNEQMAAEGPDRRWTVLDLEVDADGQTRVDFGYDRPKRVNQIIDHESMGRFEGYLDTWVAEHGPVPRPR